MKLNKILALAVPALMLASCSNDNIVPEEPNINQVLDADGYIGVKLFLPTTSGTRANDNFDDGVNTEYDVENGILVLFKEVGENTTEGDAEFIGAFDLGFPHTAEGSNNQKNVTTTYTTAVKVSGFSIKDTDKLKGLVFLNYGTANISLVSGALNIGSNECKPAGKGADGNETAGTKFSTICGYVSQLSDCQYYRGDYGSAATSIFMCNSPLSDKAGGKDEPTDVNITTLVDLTNGLKATEAEALAQPAGTIYVERAVAKVTCSKFLQDSENPVYTIAVDGKEVKYRDTTLRVTYTNDEGNEVNAGLFIAESNIEWALGNVADQSYIVRNVNDITWNLKSVISDEGYDALNNGFRMIGSAALYQNYTAKTGELYRPYFCKDPGYDTDHAAAQYKAVNAMIPWTENGIFYAFENTMPVEKMIYGNTTRLVFKVTLDALEVEDKSEGGKTISVPKANATPLSMSFYVRNDEKTKLYYEKNGKNPLEQYAYMDLSRNDNVIAAWKAALKKEDGVEGSAKFDPANDITIVTKTLTSGLIEIESIAFKENSDIYTATPTFDFKGLISTFNATYKFTKYENGTSYYEARIKHFGDDLTPWESPASAVSIDESYPEEQRDNNYLGRYGMVRNNWYDLNITGLVSLGYAADPATWDTSWPGKPDDNKDKYLAVRIAILSWAKRTQNHEF